MYRRLRKWMCRHGWHNVIADFPPQCYYCGPVWKWGQD